MANGDVRSHYLEDMRTKVILEILPGDSHPAMCMKAVPLVGLLGPGISEEAKIVRLLC